MDGQEIMAMSRELSEIELPATITRADGRELSTDVIGPHSLASVFDLAMAIAIADGSVSITL